MEEKRKPMVLSIDDDPDFNNLLKVKLKNIGIELITATDSKSFLKMYKKMKPDLCFIDINLGDMYGAGFEIIKAIHNTCEDPAIMFALSKRSTKKDIDHALNNGADDYLTKPIDMIILETKLKEFFHIENAQLELPFKKVLEERTACNFKLSLSLYNISDKGISWKSPNYISNKTNFYVEHDLFNDITGKKQPLLLSVVQSVQSEDKSHYIIVTEFDPYDHELLANVREWLIHND